MTDDYFTHQDKRQRRDSEKPSSLPLRDLYPAPKKDRREPKGKKR